MLENDEAGLPTRRLSLDSELKQAATTSTATLPGEEACASPCKSSQIQLSKSQLYCKPTPIHQSTQIYQASYPGRLALSIAAGLQSQSRVSGCRPPGLVIHEWFKSNHPGPQASTDDATKLKLQACFPLCYWIVVFSFLSYLQFPLTLLTMSFLFCMFSIARFPACLKSHNN